MKRPTLKQILPILKFSKREHRPILTKAAVKDGMLHITDFETYLTLFNTDLSDGLHNPETLHLIDTPEIEDLEDHPGLIKFDDKFDAVGSFKISQEKLSSFLPFMSKDETRPFLNGLAWNDSDLVATDGFKLKIIETEFKNENDTAILPKKSIELLIKLLKKYKIKEEIEILLNEEYCCFQVDDEFKLIGRLIQRDFPKYRAVIPTKTDKEFIIDENGYNFKELKPLLNKRNFAIKLESSGKDLMLSSTENDFKIKIGDGFQEMEIGFNGSYLADCLANIDTNVIRFNNELSPCLLESGNEKVILMPLRL